LEGNIRAVDGIRVRGVSVAARPSKQASKLPVTQLVFSARGVFPRSTPCMCARRACLAGRVFPDRTSRPHGLARLPPNWVGLAGRVVTVSTSAAASAGRTPEYVAKGTCKLLSAASVFSRGFGIMIPIKHRSVSSGILLAGTSYVHQSCHEEPEHEVSFPAVSSVSLSHWMARRF